MTCPKLKAIVIRVEEASFESYSAIFNTWLRGSKMITVWEWQHLAMALYNGPYSGKIMTKTTVGKPLTEAFPGKHVHPQVAHGPGVWKWPMSTFSGNLLFFFFLLEKTSCLL